MPDIRCPDNESRMFFRITAEGDLEVACKDCRTKARHAGRSVDLVLHTYSPVTGLLLDTNELTLERRNVTQAHRAIRLPG